MIAPHTIEAECDMLDRILDREWPIEAVRQDHPYADSLRFEFTRNGVLAFVNPANN